MASRRKNGLSKVAEPRGSQDNAEEDRVPPAIKRLISGSVIDLSGASTFYQKEAAVVEVLTNYVERLPQSRYRLKNGFDSFVRRSLPVLLAGHPAQPADALADSVTRLAESWATGIHLDSLPGDKESISAPRLDTEWKQSWQRMPKAEWDAFQQMSRPLASYILTALDSKGAVDDDLTYLPTACHVALGISFTQDLQQPPEMRILIKGEPAVRFMVAYIRKSQGRRWPIAGRQERHDLRVILDSTVSNIEKEFLGLTRRDKGRPRDIGERAAYLLLP